MAVNHKPMTLKEMEMAASAGLSKGGKMGEEKSLREILLKFAKDEELTLDQTLSAIQSYYKKRRLSKEEIGQILFATQIYTGVRIKKANGLSEEQAKLKAHAIIEAQDKKDAIL